MISDEGPGISEDLLDRVFHQYQRQTSIEDLDGHPAGLGLAIVYKYVTALEGQVRCESSEGKGATFTIEFCK